MISLLQDIICAVFEDSSKKSSQTHSQTQKLREWSGHYLFKNHSRWRVERIIDQKIMRAIALESEGIIAFDPEIS